MHILKEDPKMNSFMKDLAKYLNIKEHKVFDRTRKTALDIHGPIDIEGIV